MELIKFTAQDAAIQTEHAIKQRDAINVEDYNKIIKMIQGATHLGKTSICLDKGSDLEKNWTIGTETEFRKNGFMINRIQFHHSYNDSDYIGIEISWPSTPTLTRNLNINENFK
jgi:hypothetical protein